jgi:hypothetical protein
MGVHHEGKGGVPMDQPADIYAPAIGACLNCRQLFLVTPATPNCILCGRPADLTLPFGVPEVVASAIGLDIHEPAPEAVEPLTFEEPLDTGDLFAMISVFLIGVPEGGDELRALLVQSGADPETAATAVGRLAAVRELIAQLEQPHEPAPTAPIEEEDRTTVLSP